MLGQAGIAQSHLAISRALAAAMSSCIFGLYRRVGETAEGWRFVRGAPELHLLWGWLQVDEMYRVADIGPNDLTWARHHPHLFSTVPRRHEHRVRCVNEARI